MRLALGLPLALLALMTPALAADPYPPQLAVSFLAEPAPIVQDGSTRLVYEMQIVNTTQSPYVLDAVEAKAGETTAVNFGSIGPQHPLTDDYPAANALVTFK